MERLLRGAHTLWERTTKRLVSSRNIKYKWTAGQISAKIQRDLDSVGHSQQPPREGRQGSHRGKRWEYLKNRNLGRSQGNAN